MPDTLVRSAPPVIRLYDPAPLEPQSHWLDWLDVCRAQYGDIFTVKGSPHHQLTVVGHPDMLDHVLRQQPDTYSRVPEINAMLKRYLGDSLFTVDGTAAQEERRVLQPVMASEYLHQQVGHTQRLIDAFIEAQGVRGEAVIDLSDWMFQITMAVALGSIFGLSYPQIEPILGSYQAAFRQVSQDYTDWASTWGDTPLWHPSKRHWQFLVNRYRTYAAMKKLTHMALDDIQQASPQLDSAAMVTTWLSRMPVSQHRQLLTKHWQDRIRSVFSASFESLSSALIWSIVQLDHHPDAKNRLVDEVTQPDSTLLYSVDGHRQLVWLRACFEEAMRLYPPIYCVPRISTKADCIAGYTIEPNRFMDCSIYLVHRHPEFWPEPTTFRPDRFMPNSPIPADRQAYFPFGHGQHYCMGSNLAMLQGPLILANVYRHFSLAFERPIHRQQCLPQLTLQAVRPMPIHIQRR